MLLIITFNLKQIKYYWVPKVPSFNGNIKFIWMTLIVQDLPLNFNKIIKKKTTRWERKLLTLC